MLLSIKDAYYPEQTLFIHNDCTSEIPMFPADLEVCTFLFKFLHAAAAAPDDVTDCPAKLLFFIHKSDILIHKSDISILKTTHFIHKIDKQHNSYP